MATTISFQGWVSPPGDIRSRSPRFRVQIDEPDATFLVLLLINGTLLAHLGTTLVPGGDPESDPLIDQVLLRFGVRQIEQGLREALIDDRPPDGVHTIFVMEDDLPLLKALADTKTCRYQVEDEGDLFCSAAGLSDDTIVGSLGLRRLAPTSSPACLKCNLPNTDFICSRLTHPNVYALTVTDVGAIPPRGVMQAACEADRPEIQEPARCHAGGHGCWVRLVQPLPPEVVQPLPPEALAQALDYLDATWRLAFGRDQRLLRIHSAQEVAGLSLPARSRDELDARISDLADVMKKFSISDGLLPPDADVAPTHTLARIESAIENRLEPQEFAEAKVVIGHLRDVNTVRVGLQHSGATPAMHEAFVRLGIDAPWSDPMQTWDILRTVATHALQSLARIVRLIADRI